MPRTSRKTGCSGLPTHRKRASCGNDESVPWRAGTAVPAGVTAEMRPYQKAGFDFLCHLTRLRLGGILADDMGLGKTLQTLAWLAWLKEHYRKNAKPSLVICPASVLHNWRREAERFTAHLKVLVLESGAARHTLRKRIPQHDLIVTNYALLRRDLEALQKFDFHALILDEAQCIKNPGAQVTQSVKQMKAGPRLALTGTTVGEPVAGLWSIVDFIQPGTWATRSSSWKPMSRATPAKRRSTRNASPANACPPNCARCCCGG